MKKFFTLLTLFCMFVGAAWAGPTDLPEISTEGNIKWYTIKNTRSGKYANYAGDATKMTQVSTPSLASLFYFTSGETTTEGFTSVMIHNAVATKKFADFTSWTEEGHEWFLSIDQQNETPAGLHITRTAAIGEWNGAAGWNACNDGGGNVTNYAALDAGSVFVIEEANFETLVANAKASAIAEIEKLSPISEIYPDAASYKTSINGAENNIDGLRVIANCIDDYNKSIDGKSMKFRVDGRGSRFLGYSNGNKRVETQVFGFDDAYWTIKYVGNGYFKLYNPVHKVWLGAPDGAKKKNDDDTETSYTAGVANENEAASFKFEVKEGPTVVLVTNDGKVAHAAGDHRIMHYWDKSDRASWWAITDVCTFPISYDQYKEFLAEKSAIMSQLTGYAKQLQDKYGLVKDAEKISVVVNHPSGGDCQPSSNLLDGNNGTYVHSSYDTTMEGEEDNKAMSAGHMNQVENHYIDVELSEAAQNIFCYFSKRNNNNRPTVVEVHAGNSADALTKVATLNMAESTDGSVQSYFSEGIDLGAAYTHLRFVVTKTNTDTKYFTLSEFYVLPVNDVTNGIADLAGASILKTDLEARLTDAGNSLKTLQLPETTAEVKAALDANVDNHAEIPVLGQYTTAAYNKLKAAYDACTSIDKLEALFEAFDEFNKAKNRPVFTISGKKDYVVGKSIYDDNDGTLNFKATDLWDKTMWWALDMTETAVKVTDEVGIYNVGTGNGFWGASSIKITETNENSNAGIPDDGLFLFYTTGNNTPIHFQSDFSEIVRYGSYDATSGSAANFTYIGNSYDLYKLTDEHIAELRALKKFYQDNLYYKDVVLGDVIGEYKGDKVPVGTALDNLKEFLDQNLTALSKKSIDDLKAEANKISEAAKSLTKNLLTVGKFYQFHSAFTIFTETAAVYANDNVAAWKTLYDGEKSFYWEAVKTDKGVALKNAANGKYLMGNAETSAQWTMADAATGAEIDVVILSKDEDENYEYGIVVNGRQMHGAGHKGGESKSGTIVSWEAYLEQTPDNCSSLWYIVEYDALPSITSLTYNFKYNGEVKASESVPAAIGEEYPDPSKVVTLPYGVVIKSDKPAGVVTNMATVDFELELDLPFEVAATAETISKWYYAQMHATNSYSKYIQVTEDKKIEWSDKAVTEGEEDSYLWGFVGDVWTGIKVVNKATKEAIVSTGQDEATMGAVAGATAFIPTASNARKNTDWFCLQHPTYTTTEDDEVKNYYLNAQNGFVKHWSSADEGSSIFLTEPGMEFDVEVSDAGYATYYSAYRLAIPDGVEAYVVSDVANKYAVLTKVEGNVLPEYTAVILKAEAGEYTFGASVAETPTIASNKLKGTLVDTPVKNAYILANGDDGVGFYKALHDVDVNGGTNAETNFINHANKAYLPVDAVPAGARFLNFDFGTETGIGEVETEGENVVIYDLSGRRVQKAQKGLYIVNGKKVIK